MLANIKTGFNVSRSNGNSATWKTCERSFVVQIGYTRVEMIIKLEYDDKLKNERSFKDEIIKRIVL